MIAPPGVRVITYSANNAIELTWDYTLKGALSELKACSMRLGISKPNHEIVWVRRLDCRGNYKHGHVQEYLEEEDVPNTDKGENVYCQFLFEPEEVIDEKTGAPVKNVEREVGLSETVTLISLANAAKYRRLLKNRPKPAAARVARA